MCWLWPSNSAEFWKGGQVLKGSKFDHTQAMFFSFFMKFGVPQKKWGGGRGRGIDPEQTPLGSICPLLAVALL